MSNLLDFDLSSAIKALKNKEISSFELTNAYLNAIENTSNLGAYLDIQKVIQQEKDIKTFKKAKKKGLTFGGKTKHNRKKSKRNTRKV